MAIKIPIISEYDKRGQDDAETGLNKLGKSAKKLAKIGAAAFAAVGAGAVVMGKKLLDAGENASTANARIEQITKSMGQFDGQTAQVTDRLVDLAEKTARLTGVDQNLIKEGQALLSTFASVGKDADKVGGIFDRATKASVDLAAAGFGSVTSNAIQLGKALEDPVKGLAALGKSGVTFTKDQKELIKTLVETNRTAEAQDIILKAVESQVGGTAEATANSSDKMRVAWTQLQEKLGLKLLPAFEKFTTFVVERVIPAFEDIYQKVAPYVVTAFEKISKWLNETGLPAFKDFIAYIKAEILPKVEEMFGKFKTLGTYLYDIFGPLFRVYLKTSFEILKNAVGPMLDVLNLVLDVLNGIAKAASIAIDAVNAAIKGYNKIPLLPNIPTIPTSSAPATPVQPSAKITNNPAGKGVAIPRFADGGIVPATPGGMLGLIGEAGQSEAVIPLDRLGNFGGNVTINVTGGLSTSAEIGQAITNALRAYSRSSGPLQLNIA